MLHCARNDLVAQGGNHFCDEATELLRALLPLCSHHEQAAVPLMNRPVLALASLLTVAGSVALGARLCGLFEAGCADVG